MEDAIGMDADTFDADHSHNNMNDARNAEVQPQQLDSSPVDTESDTTDVASSTRNNDNNNDVAAEMIVGLDNSHNNENKSKDVCDDNTVTTTNDDMDQSASIAVGVGDDSMVPTSNTTTMNGNYGVIAAATATSSTNYNFFGDAASTLLQQSIQPMMMSATTTPSPPNTTATTHVSSRGNVTESSENTNSNNAMLLQTLTNENEALKDKVSKLKALLGRSAKAQRETKIELDVTQKKLNDSMKENEKLHAKIDKLSTRPTHMDMLADFETNFDRALLSAAAAHTSHSNQHQQSGGQDTASPYSLSQHHQQNPTTSSSNRYMSQNDISNNIDNNNGTGPVVDVLLLQELNDSKQRIEKLEKLNATLMDRTKHVESDIVVQLQRQITDVKSTLQHVELEKKMALLQYENSMKETQQLQESINEMQYEINLLTTSYKKSQGKISQYEQQLKSYDTDTNNIHTLQQQVRALEEWAVASNEAKSLAQERVHILEQQLKQYQCNDNKNLDGSHRGIRLNYNKNIENDDDDNNENGKVDDNNDNSEKVSGTFDNNSRHNNNNNTNERVVVSKNGSLVVGAGDLAYRCIELPDDIVKSILLSERVVLRWKFDLQNDQNDIIFTILKGKCDNGDVKMVAKRMNVRDNCLIQNRTVIGGAEGETDHAFAYEKSCTLVWNNHNAWIRPKTVKYIVEAIVVS